MFLHCLFSGDFVAFVMSDDGPRDRGEAGEYSESADMTGRKGQAET
ncbi:hypothetical protein HMPREF0083_04691 [Aneurinibacillus aneurinilyticus ATCC 12856]|uniref:Uncharacterized protein n=1 Tax=Aneurinibacillus aneurinilyticus ATCC 12856 TaxID=649747 RepID=U1WX07_ANEAE|nr:hypothetical protein HMPREF0083_04691 [Aneurinibacillus aneurinilyticus ATCC 12856]